MTFKIIATTLLHEFRSPLPDLTCFTHRHINQDQVIQALPLSNKQTTFVSNQHGVRIIPLEKYPSVFKREGTFSKIKEVTIIGRKGTFIRANIRLESEDVEGHYLRIKKAISILDGLPNVGFLTPLLHFRYTGKRGFDKVKVIMPKMEGDLLDASRKHLLRSHSSIMKVATQMILILHLLEDIRQIFHRDVKLENFLYKHDNRYRLTLYLIDFEFARGPEEDKKSCGSPNYVAPEMIDPCWSQPTHKADVWSTGMLLYTLATNHMFFDGEASIILSKIRSTPQYILNQKVMYIPHATLQSLILRMLVRNVDQRASFSELCQHPYIKQGLSLLENASYPIIDCYKFLLPPHTLPITEPDSTESCQNKTTSQPNHLVIEVRDNSPQAKDQSLTNESQNQPTELTLTQPQTTTDMSNTIDPIIQFFTTCFRPKTIRPN